MSEISDKEIDGWAASIENLYRGAVPDEDERTAAEAAANLLSGLGFLDPPATVIRMVEQAIVVGYATALRDVRDGDFDDEIRYWRSDVFDVE